MQQAPQVEGPRDERENLQAQPSHEGQPTASHTHIFNLLLEGRWIVEMEQGFVGDMG